MIEHFLRPLSVPIAPADVYHSSSNGLASLVAMAGKWEHGAQFLLTEHGVYLRERYLSLTKNDFSHPVRMVLLRFFRLLSVGRLPRSRSDDTGEHVQRPLGRTERRGHVTGAPDSQRRRSRRPSRHPTPIQRCRRCRSSAGLTR